MLKALVSRASHCIKIIVLICLITLILIQFNGYLLLLNCLVSAELYAHPTKMEICVSTGIVLEFNALLGGSDFCSKIISNIFTLFL